MGKVNRINSSINRPRQKRRPGIRVAVHAETRYVGSDQRPGHEPGPMAQREGYKNRNRIKNKKKAEWHSGGAWFYVYII